MIDRVTTPIPVIVGVTGHIDIDLQNAEALQAVKASVRGVLLTMKRQFGHALHVMTALAEGADQLVAGVALDLNIPIVAVLPMRKDMYLCRFNPDARALFEKILPKAALTLTLPHVPRSGNTSLPGFDERHFEQLGAFLARRSHVLLALWEGPRDNNPWPKAGAAAGGTADVIRMRMEHRHATGIEEKSLLFHCNGAQLETPRSGALLYIATPRVRATPKAPPGSCFMMRPGPDLPYAPRAYTWIPVTSRKKGVNSASQETKADFQKIMKLNEEIKMISLGNQVVFNKQFGYLKTPGFDGKAGEPVHLLKRLQSAVDTTAMQHQRAMVGQFSAVAITDLPGQIKKALFGEGPKPWPSILTIYGLLLPVLVLCFELRSLMMMSQLWLVGYLALSIVAFMAYVLYISKERVQDRWQDYRALAEALRVQLYWSLAGLPLAAADNYMRKQDDEVGWIRFALQGPAVWATAQALAIPTPCREAVESGWMLDQAQYFIGASKKKGKAKQNREAAERNKTFAVCAYVAGLLAVVLVLLSEYFVKGDEPELCCVLGWLHAAHEHEKAIEVFAATMPAIAAFLTLSINLRAYEAHTRSYSQMGAIFHRAYGLVQMIPVGMNTSQTAAFKNLARELGRESLAETAEWLMDHRDRRVEPPS